MSAQQADESHGKMALLVVKKEVTSEDEDTDVVGLLVDSSLKSYHQVYKEALEGSVLKSSDDVPSQITSSIRVKTEKNEESKYEHVICIKEEILDDVDTSQDVNDDDYVFKCNECEVFNDRNELMLHIASHRNKKHQTDRELVETSSANGEHSEFEDDTQEVSDLPAMSKFYSSEDEENSVEIIRTNGLKRKAEDVSYLQEDEVVIEKLLPEKKSKEHLEKRIMEIIENEINKEKELSDEHKLEDHVNGKKLKIARSDENCVKKQQNLRNSKHAAACKGFISLHQLSPRKSFPLQSKSMASNVEPMSVLKLTLPTNKQEEKKKKAVILKGGLLPKPETTPPSKREVATSSRKVVEETSAEGLLQCKECSVTFEQKSCLVMHELGHEKYRTYRQVHDKQGKPRLVENFHIRTAKPVNYVYNCKDFYIRNGKDRRDRTSGDELGPVDEPVQDDTCRDEPAREDETCRGKPARGDETCEDKPVRDETCKVEPARADTCKVEPAQEVRSGKGGVRIYPCKYCHLQFSLKSQLHMHELIHRKEKNKECRCNGTDGYSDLCLCIVRKCEWCARSFFSSKKLKNWRLCISCYLVHRSKEDPRAASLLRVQSVSGVVEDLDAKRLCLKCGKMCTNVVQCGGSWICHGCWYENLRYITYPQLRDTSHRKSYLDNTRACEYCHTKLFPRQFHHQCLHESFQAGDGGEEIELSTPELGQHFLLAGYDPSFLQDSSDDDDDDDGPDEWTWSMGMCDDDESDSSHMVVLCDKTGELIDLTSSATS